MAQPITGPLWRDASATFSERSRFQSQLQQQDALRKTPIRELGRVSSYLKSNQPINRPDQLKFPIQNLRSAVDIQSRGRVINVFA
ncbi:MAG: hypothetical protein JJU10_06945 [Idiomarina sp.]|nr:hypothetical protein [Idiomarina sp.]